MYKLPIGRMKAWQTFGSPSSRGVVVLATYILIIKTNWPRTIAVQHVCNHTWQDQDLRAYHPGLSTRCYGLALLRYTNPTYKLNFSMVKLRWAALELLIRVDAIKRPSRQQFCCAERLAPALKLSNGQRRAIAVVDLDAHALSSIFVLHR